MYLSFNTYSEIPAELRRQWAGMYLHRYTYVPEARADWRTGKTDILLVLDVACEACATPCDKAVIRAWAMYVKRGERFDFATYVRPQYRRKGVAKALAYEAKRLSLLRWPARPTATIYAHDDQATAFFTAVGCLAPRITK